MRHFLAACSKDAVGFETSVLVDVAGEGFKATGAWRQLPWSYCMLRPNYIALSTHLNGRALEYAADEPPWVLPFI